MSRKRVLVIDDISIMRQIISSLLKKNGYEAMEASSAEMGLTLMNEHKFDLILLDWNMPGMSGPEFLITIRAKDETAPVVMVTAEGDRQRVLGIKDMNVSGYLLKPFRQDALLSILKRIFADAPAVEEPKPATDETNAATRDA